MIRRLAPCLALALLLVTGAAHTAVEPLAKASFDVGDVAVAQLLLPEAETSADTFFVVGERLPGEESDEHPMCFVEDAIHHHHRACPLLREFFAAHDRDPEAIVLYGAADASWAPGGAVLDPQAAMERVYRYFGTRSSMAWSARDVGFWNPAWGPSHFGVGFAQFGFRSTAGGFGRPGFGRPGFGRPGFGHRGFGHRGFGHRGGGHRGGGGRHGGG